MTTNDIKDRLKLFQLEHIASLADYLCELEESGASGGDSWYTTLDLIKRGLEIYSATQGKEVADDQPSALQ